MNWNIHFKDFPDKGNFLDQMEFILKYALLAPNSHNTQAWKFEIDLTRECINIYLDWQRTLPYSDRFNRESYISLGCALGNLTVALANFGFTYQIKYFPEEMVKDIAIQIFIQKKKMQNDKLSDLFPYITKRVVNRFLPIKQKIRENILSEIAQYNNEKNIHAFFFTKENEKNKIADLIYQAIKYAFGDKMFKDELSKWIRSNYSKKNDGIPLYDSGIPSPFTIFAPWLIKIIPAILQAKSDQKMTSRSSALLVLASKNDNRLTWIQTGKVFEYLALAGTKHSLFFSPMAAIIEHRESRFKLSKILNTDSTPVFFARISYVDKIPPHSPRRTIEEVLR